MFRQRLPDKEFIERQAGYQEPEKLGVKVCIEQHQQHDVILDVGTAEGLFILSVVDRCKKIVLIEPNDYFVSSLRRSFHNDLDKVSIYNVAVGAQAGEISFSSASLSSGVVSNGESNIRKKMETIDHLL